MAHRVWGQALVHLNSSHSEQADEHFAESLRLFEEGGARLEAARTHLVWGQVLQARGLPEAARAHFEKAATQFESSGLTNELERTKGLIAALPAQM
jgi:tetratricopeptide (TPR) repeat protein